MKAKELGLMLDDDVRPVSDCRLLQWLCGLLNGHRWRERVPDRYVLRCTICGSEVGVVDLGRRPVIGLADDDRPDWQPPPVECQGCAGAGEVPAAVGKPGARVFCGRCGGRGWLHPHEAGPPGFRTR